jgi:hypothetical protein
MIHTCFTCSHRLLVNTYKYRTGHLVVDEVVAVCPLADLSEPDRSCVELCKAGRCRRGFVL